MVSDEQAWARAHPESQVDGGGDRLVLWNYPVARADLAAVHEAAVRRFAAVGMLAPGLASIEFSVRGHASVTGAEAANAQLSQRRAEGVGAYLRALGFSAVEVSSAGSAEPADPAPTGQSFARNRRVELTKFVSRPPDPVAPPLTLGGQQPSPSPFGGAPPGNGASAAFEGAFSADLGTLTTATVVVGVKIEGTLKGKVSSGHGAVGSTAVLKDGKWSVKLEEKLKGDLKAKLGVDPASGGKPARIKLGVQAEKWLLEPEVGVQSDPKFVYFTFTLLKAKLPDVKYDDLTVTLEFTGKLKLEVGPSPALAARLAPLVAPAVEVVATGAAATAAVAGVLVVAAVVIGGTIYASDEAARAGLLYAQVLARRDGAASRAALEALGTGSLAAFKERQLEWRKQNADSGAAFAAGTAVVESLLRALGPDERKARAAAWAATYAKSAGADSFIVVRERIFPRLGGYDQQEHDLIAEVGRL
ncbi:OmpA family protein [Streptomyces sp. NBC_00028]|uniref:OmpA family protein n=1 Tax=Streptomyces sp. NBC_00028 TaxID=2975624 RepID=UPI0032504193